MDKNFYYDFQPWLSVVRKKTITCTVKELSENYEFQTIIGQTISFDQIIKIEKSTTKTLLIQNKALFIKYEAFLIKYTNSLIKFIGSNKKDIDFNEDFLSILKESWQQKQDIKKKLKSFSKNMDQLKSKFEIVNHLITLKDLHYIPLIISFYENHICHYNYKIFEHITKSIQKLAIERQHSKKADLKYYQKFCENLLCLISKYHEDENLNTGRTVNLYFASLDLSYLDLSSNCTEKRSLKGAWLNDTDLTFSNFSGLILDDVNFDDTQSLRCACFKDTSLKNASFNRANLIGINKQNLDNDALFIDGMTKKQAGSPFLEADVVYSNNKIDDWFKKYLIKEKKKRFR